MWWLIGGSSVLVLFVWGYWHRQQGQREWQTLKRNAQSDPLKKGRWWRAITLRLFGHK